jgi:naphthoate synthase
MPDFYGDLHAPVSWEPQGDYRDVVYETSPDGIAKITINRPEVRNAFRPQTLFELSDAFNRARDDDRIGVIVLTGAGTEAFCSGGDQRIRGDDGYLGDDAVAQKGIGRLNVLDLQIQIRRTPKPVVAMVAGWAVGGGHVLHVVCDLTIAADTARFGQVGPKVGSVDPGFGTAYLARIVGEKKAREFWYLCEQHTAEECRQLGLVNKVVPAAELMEAAMDWAQRIVSMSPTAIKLAKQSFNTDTESIRGVGALGIAALGLYYGTDEAQEGQRAFSERRDPDFRQFRR